MRLRELPRSVVFLGLASLFNDISSEIVYPLLPIFLTQILGADTAMLGLIEGLAESAASLTKLASGYLYDHFPKPERFVIAGYSLAGILRPLMALVALPTQALAIRVGDRIGKGIRGAPKDAWLAGLSRSDSRGRIFGFDRAMDNLGAAIGPLLATLWLASNPGNYRGLFLFTAIPGLAAVLLVLRAWRADPERQITTPETQASNNRKLPAQFYRFLAIFFLFTLGNSSDAFLILRLKALGVPIFLIPVIWAGTNGARVISSWWGGGFSDRFGRRPAIIIGWLWYAAAYFALSWVSSPILGSVIFVLYGGYFGFTESSEKAWIADLVGAERRGRAYGWYNAAVGFGALPASLLFGWIWKEFSAETALRSGAVIALGAAMLLSLISLRSMDDRSA